ncbi:GNAT family N-acetyltransferase [Rhodopila sp.]|jgi:GNAT superfamily N-acetyltransferase|uniref:GNAT family N-acetyltransferase n=1 Tax=Rhodopila sp. TaxID=2480087 RepID=UPI002C84AE19|nr:GNAT family N-acetyltransferase [Rhodopila sp.]HVZ09792.1 GNAT family N-acetyltransferase [Rhodopila sp.]
MNCLIRSATTADLPHIVRLARGLAEYEKLLHEFTATATDFQRLLFDPDHVADGLLAEVDGTPVGIALYFRTIGTFRGQIGLFLEDLFVDPVFRGKGIGLALLRALARLAVERGYTIIEWRVLDWNEPAIGFYEKLGATRMTEWHTRRLRGPALASLAEGAPHG